MIRLCLFAKHHHLIRYPSTTEGATEMPYTAFRVELGFSAVGAIGHRKFADGICGALVVQCDEDSKGKGWYGRSCSGIFPELLGQWDLYDACP